MFSQNLGDHLMKLLINEFHIVSLVKCKCMFLYSAESSLLDCSKRVTLSSPGRPVHSDTVLGFSWKHSSHAAITRNDYSLTFPPPSIARYSFILYMWVNWGVMGRTKMPKFRNGSKGASNSGSLDCESGILPLSYRTQYAKSHNHLN